MNSFDHKYDKILNYDYKGSINHKPMDRRNRASQFAPFAALDGYQESIEKANETFDKKIYLDENAQEELNQKLQTLLTFKDKEIKIKYYENGHYVEKVLIFDKINYDSNVLIFKNNIRINIDEIIDINF